LAQQLLEWGFAHYSKLNVVQAGQPLSFEVKVSNGAAESIRPIAAQSLTYVISNEEKKDLRVTFQLPATVRAPVAAHQELGEIIVRDQGKLLGVIPAVSPIGVADSPTSTGLPFNP
jgi:D-alanyl-D-alanine carboxypeptidase (penicillin-binding protein 5/6)